MFFFQGYIGGFFYGTGKGMNMAEGRIKLAKQYGLRSVLLVTTYFGIKWGILCLQDSFLPKLISNPTSSSAITSSTSSMVV